VTIEVFDNYADPQWFEQLLEYTNQPRFWQYADLTDYDGDGTCKFVHTIYCQYVQQSELNDFLRPFYLRSEFAVLIKSKIDFTLRTETHKQNVMHTDMPFIDVPYKTGILYLTTNNGYTLFEDGTKVESVANRFVVFDGNIKHCGVSQTDVSKRICLNLNWIPPKDELRMKNTANDH
jgi:hypothetical protein